MKDKYSYHTLSNGIRIVHKQVPGQVSHMCLAVKSGSRDELPHEWGVAHFIEHMIFKGTKKRKPFHVLARMENVGGELNAFTAKEETIFYASFLKPYYHRSAELLSDIIFNSVFAQKDIDVEKDVVIEEIKSYKDNPAELSFDMFEDLIFENHPLGRNILGSVSSIRTMKRKDILSFINRTYTCDQMVIASVGNISFVKLIKILEECFGHIPSSKRTYENSVFKENSPENLFVKTNSHQSNSIYGRLSYDMHNDKKNVFSLINNLLGGPGMNTRLNISIREKNGYAYAVESSFQPLSDTGFFSVYFATDKNHVDKTISLIQNEFHKLKTEKLGTLQLSRAKKQFIGQLALSGESNLNEMVSMAKSMLFFNQIDSMADVYKRIESISASDILEISNDMLNPEAFSLITIGRK
ncbi:MAG: pitrilysin family protein [Bacteroidales bacterium]|nr:pitrilysin family protein [Bacteroidales bacterium]